MKRIRTIVRAAALSLLLSGGAHAGGVQVGEPVTAVGVDIDLRNLPVAPAWQPGMPIQEAHKRQFFPLNRPNPSAPTWMQTAPDRLPELQQLWDEQQPTAVDLRPRARVSINNAGTGVSPGDPVIDVSPNYVVYGVNSSSGTTFTVYDKTGTKLSGPTTFSSLAPSGDGCRTSVSDPIVLFDRLANRWFLLEMGGTSSAPKNCVYISKTENPVSGGWWFYGFSTPSQNDYPHCGVWNNAYVCTDNEGGSTVTFYAFDRANMLTGGTARAQQRFSSVPALSGYGFQTLTPANFMGGSGFAPPAGEQQILARHHDDEAHDGTSADSSHDFIDLFSLKLDWTTPANSAITTLPRIAITEFNSWFRDYSTFDTVPQPGSTSRLDPIREVIFNTMNYRNFGSYEQIVGDFATNMNSARSGTTVNAGIRWFELRRTKNADGTYTAWSLYQEGTYGPGDTSTNHLEGSLAVDKNGNIGMGYNVTKTSSPTVFATLRYTGRTPTDPLGVMTLAATDFATGSAVETSGRWGDYYSTVVDPADDCTFWTVGMYRPASSWNTRIADFKFGDCGTTQTTWSVSGTVSTSAGAGIAGVTVSTGTTSTTTNSSGSYTLSSLANGTYTLTPSLGGYTFSPSSSSVTVSGANITGKNFTGTPVSNTPPVANFSFTTNGLSASFTDNSSDSDGTIASRSWTFGDGGTSTATNPSHSYASAGTYSVTLTVTDNGSATNSVTKSVTVTAPTNVPPTANFTFTTSGLTATFTDASSDSDGTIASRSWTFGDSGTSTATSPSHTYAAAGTYSVTETVTDNGGATGSKTSSVTVTNPGGSVLQNGVGVAISDATVNHQQNWTMVVPAGATNLVFTLSGGTGDADLYVKFGSAPTTTSYDCRPFVSGNSETCTISTVQAGTYYVMVNAYAAYSGVTLKGSYSTGSGGSALTSGVPVTGLSATTGNFGTIYTLAVPAGKTKVTVTISGGTGDADLYVRIGSAPTTATYDCRPYLSGNSETCTFNSPVAGTYYVGVRAFSTYSGVTLTGTVQ
jgi:PKD repeat protein